MGFKIAQGYGLAESSGGGMMNNPSRPELGTGGAAHPGTELRIGEGEEIQMRGPTIMSGGYLNRPDKTTESFTEDGWYRTGDTGAVVKATGPVSSLRLAGLTALGTGAGSAIGAALGNPLIGAAIGGVAAGTVSLFTGAARTKGEDHFAITGRMKSQFKLPGGEYVTPEPIEASLQGSPYIARSLVVGDDSRDLVGALIQPNFETLTQWAKERNIPTEPKEMVRDPQVLKLFEDEAQQRSSGFRKHEVVRRVALLDRELSGDEITSKDEVMRKIVTENYKEQLEGMFN
jgi:long-subunit acyl-CoA synthetase (AMP-forming)